MQAGRQVLQVRLFELVERLVLRHVLVDVRDVIDGLLRILLQCVLHVYKGLVRRIQLLLRKPKSNVKSNNRQLHTTRKLSDLSRASFCLFSRSSYD